MQGNKLFKRALSLLLCLALLLAYLPASAMKAAAAGDPLNVVSDSKKSDPSTIDDWKDYFGPDKLDTEFAGAVWTDKSVFTGATGALPGVTLTDSRNFLVALSAIASNLSITGHTSAPTDTMLVLDLSGSMVDDTYEVGTIRQGNNNYQTVDGIDMSLINAMIEATNDTIDKLMKQNTNNRVGVVLYSGNTSSNQAATPGTATVILPLGRYTGIDGEYLSVDTTYRTEALYRYVSSWGGGRWQATGESATYVPEDTAVQVSVKNGLKTESGGNVTDSSKQAVGGTYIQNGLYQAMNQFLAVTDTIVPEGRPQAGAERMPVIVLMSDGAPTIATTNYSARNNALGDSNVGDGTTTNDRITFLTQLTAAYVRGRVAAKYQESASDAKDVLFLTLGLGTENSSAATNTLYPAGSNSTLAGYWRSYLAGTAGRNVQIISGNGGLSVYREAAVEAMNYVDKYYYASDAQSLVNSFEQILGEIQLKAESYATLVESSGANFSGYVTFDDELGEMMHVAGIKGILMSDGNGGKVLYTGKGIAESLTTGVLGTVDDPTARGDELVRTVRERIPGLTTTQAQQLIGYAYNDDQLYFRSNSDWSNYIGWYADENGNYVGFWDKDSGYENAPAGAVYANRSYGYLGVNGDSDMMHVVVMVRTELATLHQTVLFKIPASLLPTVHYSVTLDENDPTKVEKFEREDAIPMQLVFEAGLRPDINSVNLEQKIAEHIRKGGHVHRNNDGTVTFYTNEWAIGNDTNGNGIPDPEEVDTAIVTQSHFHPALDNSRFYYTEDTVILTGNGTTVTGSSRPTDTDGNAANGTGYYYNRYIYSSTGRQAIRTPIAATTLANDARYDSVNGYWYVPEGTMYHNLARFQTPKSANTTGTLAYSFFPAVFDSVSKQDVYTFLGNNGTFTVAPAQGIALTKTVAELSDDPNAPTTFTFTVTLSQAVANPVITDTDGNALTGISSVNGNQITVTLKAGQTVVISGIPTGTTYTVEEAVTDYYTATSGNASGTVAANTVHAVDFVNAAKGYGNLVVSKDVNYPQGFVPGADHNSKEFPITVTFSGDISVMVAPQNATRNGNAFTLMLKDGQSATFANILEGVTYTVSEGQVPTGYAFQEVRYSDANRVIEDNDLDEAHVINSYSLFPVHPNVKIQGEKTLDTNEADWGGETFTVELLRINNFADQDPDPTGLYDTMTESDPHYEIDLSSIPFTSPGTYYFRAVEKIPENRNENIAYDRTYGLFSITVGDADADGALEVQAVNAYQTTTVSGDNTNGWILEKDFINVVTTDRIYLNIQKLVEDAQTGASITEHRGDITFGLFRAMAAGGTPSYYTLTNTLGEATIMIPVTKEIIEREGTNGRLVYFMREIAPSVENRVVGMHYDESWIYAISIQWNDTENKADVSYAPIENGQIGSYSAYPATGFVFEHTNTYEDDVKVELDLSGKKTLNGRDELGGRVFNFSLYESSAAFVKGNLIKTVSNNGNNIAFENIPFTTPGVYYMVAKENVPDPQMGGISIDTIEYHITVEIEKFPDTDGTTRLRLVQGYPTVVAYGTSDNVGVEGLNFNNLYTVSGSGNVTIGGKKFLGGRALVAEEFTIGLYRDADCTDKIETVTNRADGTFSFSTIPYTSADLGENYATTVFTYYVKEVPGTKGGVTYDPNVYTVTVTVSHEDGALVVTPSGNATTLQITNNYKADKVGVKLNGSKVLSGDWTSALNQLNSFTFNLYPADSSFALTGQIPVKTATVAGDKAYFDAGAEFSIELEYEDGDEGFYYYVLKEDASVEAGGVGYDAGEYHITVNVSDPGDGKLAAQVTMYRPGAGNASVATFTNAYDVESTTVTLTGTKTFINSVTDEPIAMQEGQFSFLVLEGDHPVSSGYNLADGTIVFTPIRYTSAGTHTYSVVEVPGSNAGGVDYDATVFTVTVTVVDNGDGTLTAFTNYHGYPIAFENTYTHGAAQVIFNGEKLLSGNWDLVPESNKLFTFELYETDSDFTVSGDPAASVASPEGAFTFGALNYTTAGTHYYVVMEHAGIPGVGITYDTAKYHITVVVTDDGNGNLIPSVTAEESSVTITPDAQNIRLATVAGLKFTNTYATTPAQFTPEAYKVYTGDEMKAFDFILSVDGKDVQTKQNDAEGKIVFDTLTFDTVGRYALTIREQENILWGLIRWDTNIYTVTLQVIDNGLGQLCVDTANLSIASEKGIDDLTFRNTHHDIITSKDVFTVSEPTVSIDGKAVEKGDILLYKITYTNYDGVPVDIEITDIIPQHTTYVEGSADNGGVYADGTVCWTLEDVAPNAAVTVSFQVKVVDANITVVNGATVLEGENEYRTNEVTNPVKEDTVIKDVFTVSAPTVSIDGKAVNSGELLLYKITYTNADDLAAEVTITDTIPEHTAYVEGSADNGGVYADGVITWKLQLAAGESKTVSFQVKVAGSKVTITNQATALEGENKLQTNQVTTPVEKDTVVKDVFSVTEPTVSIDGKKVEKGDILLYKITYTNFDGLAAEVTVTDAIPEYTAYVDGSADNGGIFSEGVITWKLQLAAGESKTVSFQVKVTGNHGQTVVNQATALEGENKLQTNQVTNPIETDTVIKDVFSVSKPTVSIDGKRVNKGDVLLYTITYTNADDLAADVTIADAIPQYTAYVEGSADNGGVYADGVITWKLQLAAGESKTVSFRVTVADKAGETIVNRAYTLEGENKLQTNQVTNRITAPNDVPKTGDASVIQNWFSLMFISGGGIIGTTLWGAKKKESEEE